MTPALREQVRQRAQDRCEYCQLPQACTILPHEADHIRSLKHAGPTTLENLAWACAQCNGFKQSDIAGYLPGTERIIRLFHPRLDRWEEHFRWEQGTLVGTSDVGIVTVYVLGINRPERVEHRQLLMQLKRYFPPSE